jgi:hypothetical protein
VSNTVIYRLEPVQDVPFGHKVSDTSSTGITKGDVDVENDLMVAGATTSDRERVAAPFIMVKF